MPATWSLKCTSATTTGLSLLLASLLFGVSFAPVKAQPVERSGDAFYGKLGAGFSDYTGDFPIQNTAQPYDMQEFTRGSGFPFMAAGEVGYQFTPKFSLGLGLQWGNYPLLGEDYTGSDGYRYTPQLLGRYTFGDPSQKTALYLDGGVNATLGGATDMGIGPSLGLGVDILLSRSLSFYVESRFNLTLPDDAIDGIVYPDDAGPNSNPKGSVTGPFDSVNQLLGFGLTFRFTGPTPPRVIALDGPTEAPTGEEVTFSATVNEGEITRPARYQWQFGDGSSSTGRTASHTYSQAGTYEVTFTARNDAGSATRTATVKVTRPAMPPKVASIDVPSEVEVGTSASFTGAVNKKMAARPLSYQWEFGDGTTSEGQTASHTYQQPGTYEVTLTVRNEAGEASESTVVSVAPSSMAAPAEIASIGATPNPARAGASIRFSSTVEGASPITQEWNFGDETTATGASPTHTYDEPGQYTVRFEVSNEGGSDARTLTVRVRSPLADRWSIVVASMTQPESAEKIAEKYRSRFTSFPVAVVEAETSAGTRHRVTVGQFTAQSEARRVMKQYKDQLPSGAWLLPPQ